MFSLLACKWFRTLLFLTTKACCGKLSVLGTCFTYICNYIYIYMFGGKLIFFKRPQLFPSLDYFPLLCNSKVPVIKGAVYFPTPWIQVVLWVTLPDRIWQNWYCAVLRLLDSSHISACSFRTQPPLKDPLLKYWWKLNSFFSHFWTFFGSLIIILAALYYGLSKKDPNILLELIIPLPVTKTIAVLARLQGERDKSFVTYV